jgi:hypothetical protein
MSKNDPDDPRPALSDRTDPRQGRLFPLPAGVGRESWACQLSLKVCGLAGKHARPWFEPRDR